MHSKASLILLCSQVAKKALLYILYVYIVKVGLKLVHGLLPMGIAELLWLQSTDNYYHAWVAAHEASGFGLTVRLLAPCGAP